MNDATHKSVPVEPTPAMLDALFNSEPGGLRAAYHAMLAAAPSSAEERGERFHFYQLGLKAAREIVTQTRDKIDGYHWNALASATQDGALQAIRRILENIDEQLREGK